MAKCWCVDERSLTESCLILWGRLQEHPHADLVPLQDLLARLPHMLLPLDVALSTALLERKHKKGRGQKLVRAWKEWKGKRMNRFIRISSQHLFLMCHQKPRHDVTFPPHIHPSLLLLWHHFQFLLNKRNAAVGIFLYSVCSICCWCCHCRDLDLHRHG